MKLKILILGAVLCLAAVNTHAGIPVIDPSNLTQNTFGAVKSGTTASNMIKNFAETKKIYQQAKKYYDALKKVNNLIKSSRKVQQTILMVGEISDIYMRNYEKMLHDPYFSVEELHAINQGYAILLGESSNILGDLKQIVNSNNGLSMNDKERIDIIDQCYTRASEFKGLVQYYTNKNIGVSYLRAKKQNDHRRVLSLYGSPSERYW